MIITALLRCIDIMIDSKDLQRLLNLVVGGNLQHLDEYSECVKEYLQGCYDEHIETIKEKEMTKSQSKFAAGDKVVCSEEYLHSGENFMFKHGEYIVSKCDEYFVEFEGKPNYRYLVKSFDLVSPAPQRKFAAGDKVVALKEFHTIKIGDILTVEHILGYWFQAGECRGYTLNAKNYELYKPAFKNMKFRVNSPEHSKEIQEALFEMGYTWQFWGKEVIIADKGFPACYWLYTDVDGILYRDTSMPQMHFQECVVETTKSYKLIPVVAPKETITIDGKQYDKEAVLKRLAELESV